MVSVAIAGPLRPSRFVDRPNPFRVRVVLEPEEETVEAYVPETGRFAALFAPDQAVWVRPKGPSAGEEGWVAALIRSSGGSLVCLDGELSKPLVEAALQEEAITELEGFGLPRTDARFGTSRFSFELDNLMGQKAFLEVETVTLVENQVALFPDATNPRATRQARSLARLAERGEASCALMFIVPRVDAGLVMPARHIDPEYTEALREAREAGVRLLAHRCQVTLEELVLGVPLEVRIPAAR